MTALGRALRAARWALLLAVCLPAPLHARSRAVWETVGRITFYQESGVTASGVYTAPDMVACSTDIALGATVWIDGDPYACTDRGELGDGSAYTWLDIYAPDGWSWVPQRYGSWADVIVEE